MKLTNNLINNKTMKQDFKPLYIKEQLVLLDREFLADVICRQEREIHELFEEKKEILKEFKNAINLIK